MTNLVAKLAGHPSATALAEGDRRVTYGELQDLVLRTAAGLRDHGLTSGARVAVAADSTVDGVVAFIGAQAAGLVPVVVSSRSPLAETERRFDEADPAAVLLGTAREMALPSGLDVMVPARSARSDVQAADADPIGAFHGGPDDPAAVLYTSGVSGPPRPVVLTHGNMAATGKGLVDLHGGRIDPSTVALCAVSLAHVFGLNSVLGTVLRAGGKVVLSDDTDPGHLAELVARHRVTMLGAVPAMWKALAATESPDLFGSVTRPTFSAAPMPPSVREAVRESLGLVVVGGFGMTETAGTICHDDITAPTAGSLGRPLGQTEIRIVEESGEDVFAGDFGELLVRGPSVTRHYLDGSPVALDEQGWLHTGDLATFDDEGRMAIVDREKDVINVNGFNVSPAEVETALAEHPAVAASAVVGDLDGDREIVVAHVVLRTPGGTSANDLTEHCRDRLSRYKVPTRVFLHEELPVTDSGKAVRRLLATG